MSIVKMGLMGASGRMGKWVCSLADSDFKNRIQLTSVLRRNESLSLQSLLSSDVVIDFSSPAAMCELAALALRSDNRHLPGFVVGSTGWDSPGLELLNQLAKKTPVLLASNFSVGVLILREILKEYSPILQQFGFTPTITEAHHQHKKDAPSGTALALREAVRPTHPESVQTHSLRAGETIGDHDVTFFGKAEKLSLIHSAQERSLFARGAIQAALWLQNLRGQENRPNGILNMDQFFQSLKESPHGNI